MYDEIIVSIIEGMSNTLTDNNLKSLKELLTITLCNYNIEKKQNEIMKLDTTYQSFLNLFLSRKMIEGRSTGTIKIYKYHLEKLLYSLNKNIDDITENDLFSYIFKYKSLNNVSDGYLEHMRLIFSSFFTWLHDKDYITKNPTKSLDPIKSEKKLKKPFTDEEMEKIKQSCNNKRDIAIVEFLYSTGVRVSELCGLNISDVNFLENKVIVSGKGKKEREVYLTPVALYRLKDYILSRKDKTNCLFKSLKSQNRVTKDSVEKMLKRIGIKANVKKCHPHRYRRTLATNVLKKGMPIEEVKELLGHEKLDTTLIYCTISKEKIRHSHSLLMSL